MNENLQTIFLTRQYMVKKDFELYYYHNTGKLPPVHLHNHDYYELYFFISGNVDIIVGSENYTLSHGDLIFVPPGVFHQSIIKNLDIPYSRFVLWISKDYFAGLSAESADYLYIADYASKKQQYLFHNDRTVFNAIQSRIFRILEEQHLQPFGFQTQSHLCLNDLLIFLNRQLYDQIHTETVKSESLYAALLNYIEEHLHENLSLDVLASAFFVSKFHISHTFKNFSGISIHQYITKKRLQACREAIESGEAIGGLAHRFGFSDYSCFYRAFKKEFGITPRDCRDMILLHSDEHR